jgi:hypothetical protein
MLKQLHYKHLRCYSYGSIIEYENLVNKDFSKYDRFYLTVPKTLQNLSDLKALIYKFIGRVIGMVFQRHMLEL